MHPFPLLLDALARGSVRLELGRVSGCCGYVDPRTRTIVLNPESPPDEQEAGLRDALAHLREQPPLDDQGPDRPHLRLLEGGAQVSPRHDRDDGAVGQ